MHVAGISPCWQQTSGYCRTFLGSCFRCVVVLSFAPVILILVREALIHTARTSMNRVCVARSSRPFTSDVVRFNPEHGKVAAAYPQNGVATRRAAAKAAADFASGMTPTARAQQHDTSLVVQHRPAVRRVYDYFATGRFCNLVRAMRYCLHHSTMWGKHHSLCARMCAVCIRRRASLLLPRRISPEQPILGDLRCLAHSALLYWQGGVSRMPRVTSRVASSHYHNTQAHPLVVYKIALVFRGAAVAPKACPWKIQAHFSPV